MINTGTSELFLYDKTTPWIQVCAFEHEIRIQISTSHQRSHQYSYQSTKNSSQRQKYEH